MSTVICQSYSTCTAPATITWGTLHLCRYHAERAEAEITRQLRYAPLPAHHPQIVALLESLRALRDQLSAPSVPELRFTAAQVYRDGPLGS